MNVKSLLRKAFQRAFFITSKNIELAVFFFFLITSLFLGDGKQPFVDVWWALGILMMYGVRYYQRGKLDLRPLPRPIGFAWAALIVYYIILIPFSDSAGYSITTTTRLIEAYLVYLLFSTTSSDRAIALFTHGLLFVGIVATLVSFVFFFSPSFANFLPSMNLLYATHGHNHLAGLLLFIFPVAVGLVEKKKGLISVGLLVFFTIGTLLTFARGAWILLVLYLIFLFLQNKNTYLKKIVLVGTGTLVVFFLAVSLLGRSEVGVALSQKMPRLSRLIQKPSLVKDGRWEYWRQATEAIKERPLFGSGPGTFFLQSKRLQAAPSSYSWFAHSFPLQITVESGVIGLATFLFLFWNVFRKSKRTPLLWGAALVLVYGFYEFTLDYTTIWLLVWVVFGASLKHDTQIQDKPKIVAATLIVLALFYVSSIGSTMASVAGNQPLAFFLAPYDTNKAKELLEKQNKERNDTLAIQTPIIMFFHGVNPDAYAPFVDMSNDESEKQRRKETTVSLDPWKRNEYNIVEYYVQRREWTRAQQEITKMLDMWAEAKRIRGYEADYTKKQELSKQMLVTGDGLFIEKKPTEAAAWYMQAQRVNAWALAAHRPVFLDYPLSSKGKTEFFQGLGNTQGKYLGRYREDYVREYLLALKEAARDYTITDFFSHAEAIVRLDPWIHSTAWDEVGSSLLEKAKEEKESNRYQEALAVLLEGVSFWKTLTNGGQQVDWRLQHDFAEELVFVGNLLAPSQLPLTAQAYQNATLLVPWILSGKEPWFEEYAQEKIEVGSLISYINTTATGDEWEKRSRAYAALFLIDKVVGDNNPTTVDGYVKQLKDMSPADYAFREKLTKKLQKLADQLLLDKKTGSAESAILIMSKILPEDYWVQAQLGHFYVNTGDAEAAERAYKDCLAASQSRRHDDCFYGLQALEAGRPNTERYRQASQIIQGTASWRDF